MTAPQPPRAVRRAIQHRTRPSDEEIARLRALKMERKAAEAAAAPPPPPAPEVHKPQVKHDPMRAVRVKAANQWFTPGQKGQLARIVPAAAAMAYLAHRSGQNQPKAGVGKRDVKRTAEGAAGGAGLAYSADTVVGAGLKQADLAARTRYKAKHTEEEWQAVNRAQREHGGRFGLHDERGRPRLLNPATDEAHLTNRAKNTYFRTFPTRTKPEHGIAGLKIPGARLKRINSHRDLKIKTVLGAGALLGAAAANHNDVNKSALADALSRLPRWAGKHKKAIGVPAGIAAAAGVQGHRQDAAQGGGHRSRQAAGAALAGQGAYRATGYGALKLADREDRKAMARGYTRSQAENHKQMARRGAGIVGNPRTHEERALMARHTPNGAPGASLRRLVGHLGGKQGWAINTAATAAPAALVLSSKPHQVNKRSELREWRQRESAERKRNDKFELAFGALGAAGGAFAARKRPGVDRMLAALPGTAAAGQAGYHLRSPHRYEVGKRQYGYVENKRSLPRTAEMGAGLGIGAWGAARLPIDSTLAHGVRIATVKGKGRQARHGADLVRRGQRQLHRTTGIAESGLRNRIPGFGTALDAIPAKMRPAVATAGGALLVARAHPTHDERFTPTGGFA